MRNFAQCWWFSSEHDRLSSGQSVDVTNILCFYFTFPSSLDTLWALITIEGWKERDHETKSRPATTESDQNQTDRLLQPGLMGIGKSFFFVESVEFSFNYCYCCGHYHKFWISAGKSKAVVSGLSRNIQMNEHRTADDELVPERHRNQKCVNHSV